MVLRKERSTPSEGNLSSSSSLTTITSSASSSSSRIMSNEQPVTKRQKIDNRNLIGLRVDGGRDQSSTTTTTSVTINPSISLSSSSSSSSSSLKDDQEIPPDILVHPSTSSSLSSSSGICLQSSLSSSLQSAISVGHNNLNENHHNCSSSSINSSLSSNSSQDEVDRVILSGNNNNNHHHHHNSSDIPDLLRLSNGTSGLRSNTTKITNFNNNNSNNTNDVKEFEEYLMKQCLCNINERILRKSFLNYYFGATIQQQQQQQQTTSGTTTTSTILHLYELPTNKLIQFLSNLQLLFDIYLKQNQKGFICSRIMEICNAIIHNDVDLHHHHHHNHHYHQNYSSYDHHFSQQHHYHHHNHHNNSLYNFNYNLIDEIIELNNYHNKYVQFLSIKVLSSFLVISKTQMIDNWLKKLVDNLFVFDDTQNLTYNTVKKINFSLEIIKRIVEWKDIDIHPLDDDDDNDNDNNNDNNDNDDIIDGNSGSNNIINNGNDNILRNAGILLQQQQPLLENNYFAIHYNSEIQSTSSNSLGLPSTSSSSNGMNLLLSSNNTNLKNNRLKKRQMIENNDTAGTSSSSNNNDGNGSGGNNCSTIISSDNNNICHLITLTDSESFDTTQLKCLTIKILENKWPALVKNMSTLIQTYQQIDNSENCILTFLLLWENIISVKANLSIIETLPFYSQLDKFEILLLNSNLSCIIYKQMLNLFNESLCYGSTLALQDLLPEETCQLAHQIVRHVKDYRILDSLPKRKIENCISFIGYRGKIINYNYNNYNFNYDRILDNSDTDNDLIDDIDDDNHHNHHNHNHHDDDGDENNTIISTTSSISSYDMDKTILQKMVLLILKSIAVTVKEIRSDSSDSSIDSQDYDAFQDMILIERSIRDVLKKLELFIKQQLEFHPECHFSKILIHLFDDQDDYLIEAMVCTLDVTSGISFRNNAFPELVAMLNPIYTFLEFLKMISNSTDLLLDLLVSNETCFLLYLLRFLKYIRLNWSMFVASCHEFNGSGSGSSYRLPYLQNQQQQIMGMIASSSSSSSATGSGILTGNNGGGLGMSGIGTTNTTLDDAMSVLIRLRLQISRLVSKSLYPYDISPVLRLLESCESLYEGNELS